MTKAKHVAQTLKTILEDPMMINILDKRIDMTSTINHVQNYWTYDLFNRRPSAAYSEDGVFQGDRFRYGLFSIHTYWKKRSY